MRSINWKYGLLLVPCLFFLMSPLFPGNDFAFAASESILKSQGPGYPQPQVTYYRFTPIGFDVIIFLGILLIILVAAIVYLIIVYKKRMDGLDQKISRYDIQIKDLYQKQQVDLNKMMEHIYELGKRSEPKKPGQ